MSSDSESSQGSPGAPASFGHNHTSFPRRGRSPQNSAAGERRLQRRGMPDANGAGAPDSSVTGLPTPPPRRKRRRTAAPDCGARKSRDVPEVFSESCWEDVFERMLPWRNIESKHKNSNSKRRFPCS
ncbi:hypothetical protein Acr_18g0000850 [Actinidia rufa]|uniref:Uncharacterized protein n=1 Tax=Actinidia rufa TaxID=165716 RepID=A0A7J0G550_9ERIC|nr:hypothetical protein Acr_18g0000850 [Actinidia rufa]